jgi:hypothetical protein
MSSQKTGTEMIRERFVSFDHMTRLMTLEKSILFSRSENFKSYTENPSGKQIASRKQMLHVPVNIASPNSN